mmetsp:Transcript_39549/g.112161  ORF Transcript_39549/g.112161 Transcript_39549/m.112161 type:complete len:219 (+) Transcript_39549:739-1395(+)
MLSVTCWMVASYTRTSSCVMSDCPCCLVASMYFIRTTRNVSSRSLDSFFTAISMACCRDVSDFSLPVTIAAPSDTIISSTTFCTIRSMVSPAAEISARAISCGLGPAVSTARAIPTTPLLLPLLASIRGSRLGGGACRLRTSKAGTLVRGGLQAGSSGLLARLSRVPMAQQLLPRAEVSIFGETEFLKQRRLRPFVASSWLCLGLLRSREGGAEVFVL